MKSFNSWMHKKEKKYNFDDVLRLAKLANVDKKELNKYEEKQLIDGINSEKEHAIGKFNVIGKNEEKILKIALAHLEEDKEYYSKLKNCVEKK